MGRSLAAGALYLNSKIQKRLLDKRQMATLRLTSVVGIGHAEDPNPRFRKQMEDVCVMIDKLGNSHSTGFFAIYDGHGGQEAARIAGDNLHRYLLEDLLNQKLEHLLEADPLANQSINQPAGPQAGSKLSPDGYSVGGNPPGGSKDSQLNSAISSGVRTGTFSKDKIPPSGKARVPVPPNEPSKLGTIIRKAIQRTDDVLRQKNVLYVGCTALIALVTKYTIEFASVGDSRAVISINGTAYRCTEDHKASDKQEIDRIKSLGGTVIFGRVNGFISVSRALGDHCIKNLVTCDPFLRSYPRYPAPDSVGVTANSTNELDEFIIMACDGVWDVVTDQQSVDTVRKCLKETGSPQKAAFELKNLAIRSGTQDNVSVLVLLLREISKWI